MRRLVRIPLPGHRVAEPPRTTLTLYRDARAAREDGPPESMQGAVWNPPDPPPE
ncbi:MAG: hypothetical protein R6W82_02360 [bacterium]